MNYFRENFKRFHTAYPVFPPIQKQVDHILDIQKQVDYIFINLYGPEYGQPGAMKRKLAQRSEVTHTLVKLLDSPQPKCQ